jgi:tetratricopeptide (TPR) repeat protein
VALSIVVSASAPSTAEGQITDEASAPKTQVATTVEANDPLLTEALMRVAVERSAPHLLAAAHRYYQLRIRDRAMDLYSEAIRRDSRLASAFDGRARVWRDWGMLEHAMGDAYRATYFAPYSGEAWNTLGTILQAMNRLTDARAAFTRATRAGGETPYAWNNLCYLSFTSAHIAQALTECSNALAEDPENRYAQNNLALIHAARGDLSEASDLFLEAGGEAARQFNMGIVQLALKNYSGAARAFEAAARAEPSMERAHTRARDARLRARRETSRDRH